MIVTVAVTPFLNIGVDQPDLVILHLGIAFGDRARPGTQRFHFRTGQHDSRFKLVIQKIVITRAPIFRDDPLLVKFFRPRFCHQTSPAPSRAASTALRLASDGGVIGKRRSVEKFSSTRDMAYLTGPGDASENKALCSG